MGGPKDTMTPLLEVKNLHTQFRTDDGLVKAVDDVSFTINEQEIVGVVGESGCGKSVTQLSVMRLIRPPGKITQGEILFEGRDLMAYEANGPEMRSVRGGKIAMIFQEPMTSLNPVLTIGRQLTEMPELHLKMNKKEAKARATELLEMVGIPNAETRLGDYPHQFSGGMRQRAMIAMALSCNPRLVIADEPTTALDVTTQAQLLEMMVAAVAKFNSSLVIVTHNLGVVARYAQTLYIMYAGTHRRERHLQRSIRPSPASLHHRPTALRTAHRRRGGPPAGSHPGPAPQLGPHDGQVRLPAPLHLCGGALSVRPLARA